MESMFKQTCAVVENEKIAPGHWVLKLRSRSIADTAKPGQFVQVLCADDSYDPLLPRPFSFLSAKGDVFSLLYQVVGKGTELMSRVKKGGSFRILGPLGNGFWLTAAPQAVLVGGGVGIPPLFHLAQLLVEFKRAYPAKGGSLPAGQAGAFGGKRSIHVFLGARNKSLLLCEKEFKKLGIHLSTATDDGTRGHKGLVTDIFGEFLKKADASKTQVYTCGPTPMLKAVSNLSAKFKAPCQVSVEVPMACGFGACLGCAIKVKKEKGEHRFAIACTEGPVFQGSDIAWD
jgi:dihydroorotate dehydrogenase electron transfer subunit